MLIWLVWVEGFGYRECIVFVFMKSDKNYISAVEKVKDCCCWRGESMEFARADDAINMPASLQCRACSSACSLPDLRFIFSDSSVVDRQIAEMMAYVTGLQIARSDGLPDQICRECISLAESATLFKEQCCRADANFRSLLGKVRDGGHCTGIKREQDCPLEMETQEYTPLPNSRHIIKEDSIDSSGVDVNSQEASERDAPYQCAVCSLRFLLCSKLKEHIKGEHGDIPKRKSLKMKVTKSKFSCPLCSKAFRSLTTYNSHYRRCENKSLQPKKSKEKKIKEEMVSSDSDTPLAENLRFDDPHSDSESIPMKELPIETIDKVSIDDNTVIKTEHQSVPAPAAAAALAPIESDEIKSEIIKKNKSYTCEECEMSFTWKMFTVHMKIEHSTDITEKPAKYRKGSKKSHKNNGVLEKKKSKKRKPESNDPTVQMDIMWNGDDNSGEDGKDLKTAVPYSCTLCERKFSKMTALSLHLKKHEDQLSEVHCCLTCKREFKRKAHLDNHILTHSVEKGFKCNLCDKAFARQDSLSMHIANHEGIKKHQCNFCDKGFNMLSTLKDHIRTHTGEKPFLCSICGRGFSQSTNLKEHVRRHQGYKPFKCSFCAQTFVSKGELEAHTRKHSGAHPFVCDVCGGGFTTSSSLVKHKRIHTGERPYQCDFCPMRFTALGTLKNHRRTHTGEKPYKCIYCDKAFAQKNDLVSHTRTHTGERPYVCSVCSHAFRQSSALKTHFKIHGGMSEQDASRLDMACIKVPDPMMVITGLGATVSKISDDNNSSMNLMTPKSETSQQ